MRDVTLTVVALMVQFALMVSDSIEILFGPVQAVWIPAVLQGITSDRR